MHSHRSQTHVTQTYKAHRQTNTSQVEIVEYDGRLMGYMQAQPTCKKVIYELRQKFKLTILKSNLYVWERHMIVKCTALFCFGGSRLRRTA